MGVKFNLSFMIVAVLLAVFLFTQKPRENEVTVKEALESCIDEIENKCKGLYEYSIMLEKENARLSKKVHECRSSK